MIYTIDIRDDYTPPEGPLDAQKYVEFVMNRAAESYQNQYGTATANEGVQAATDAYNATLPPAPPVLSQDEGPEADTPKQPEGPDHAIDPAT